MTSTSDPTSDFERLRGRLFGLAYRMLGARADAEDVVQDTYLRWHQTDRAVVANPEAWLVTTATRLAIDRLRRMKKEREGYPGAWLPEPLVSDGPAAGLELASDLSLAFLVLLERLAPDERAAFLLHDVFDVGYGEIAAILDRTEAACRQVVHRARTRVRGGRKRFDAGEAARAGVLRRFAAAVEAGDRQALMSLVAPDATWTADGGGKAAAGLHPIRGADRIVRLLLGIRERFWHQRRTLTVAMVNGELGVLVRDDDRLTSVMAIDTDGERIRDVYAVVNPDKLSQPAGPRVFGVEDERSEV